MRNNTAASPDSKASSKVGLPVTYLQTCFADSGATQATAGLSPPTSFSVCLSILELRILFTACPVGEGVLTSLPLQPFVSISCSRFQASQLQATLRSSTHRTLKRPVIPDFPLYPSSRIPRASSPFLWPYPLRVSVPRA